MTEPLSGPRGLIHVQSSGLFDRFCVDGKNGVWATPWRFSFLPASKDDMDWAIAMALNEGNDSLLLGDF